MGTYLEFDLRRGQAMRDLRDAVINTPQARLGVNGEVFLIFTKPNGEQVHVALRDKQECVAQEVPATLPRARQLKSKAIRG